MVPVNPGFFLKITGTGIIITKKGPGFTGTGIPVGHQQVALSTATHSPYQFGLSEKETIQTIKSICQKVIRYFCISAPSVCSKFSMLSFKSSMLAIHKLSIYICFLCTNTHMNTGSQDLVTSTRMYTSCRCTEVFEVHKFLMNGNCQCTQDVVVHKLSYALLSIYASCRTQVHKLSVYENCSMFYSQVVNACSKLSMF